MSYKRYKSQSELGEKIRYKAWLISYSFRCCFKLTVDGFISLLQKQVFLAVVFITTAVGFRYYILGADTNMDTMASSVVPTDITIDVPTISSLNLAAGEIIRPSADPLFLTELDQNNMASRNVITKAVTMMNVTKIINMSKKRLK